MLSIAPIFLHTFLRLTIVYLKEIGLKANYSNACALLLLRRHSSNSLFGKRFFAVYGANLLSLDQATIPENSNVLCCTLVTHHIFPKAVYILTIGKEIELHFGSLIIRISL